MEWSAETIRRKQKEFIFPNVATYYAESLVVASGQGMHLTDADGKRYLDFFGGILTVSVGHCHPRVTEETVAQQRKLVHVSTLFPTEPQVRLAEKLVQIGPMKPNKRTTASPPPRWRASSTRTRPTATAAT